VLGFGSVLIVDGEDFLELVAAGFFGAVGAGFASAGCGDGIVGATSGAIATVVAGMAVWR